MNSPQVKVWDRSFANCTKMTEPASFSLQGIRIQMRLEHVDFSKVDLLSDKLSRFKKSLLMFEKT